MLYLELVSKTKLHTLVKIPSNFLVKRSDFRSPC